MLINVHDARANFSKRLASAHVGLEIILAKAGKPDARIAPLATIPPKRRRGRVKGIIDDAFFDPLSEAEIKVWEAG